MNICSIQGGGTRGIMQTTILDNLHYQPDLVAGTSVGAMIAAALALNIPMSQGTQFFLQQAPNIFSGQWWIPISRLWSPAKYSSSNLQVALTSILGDATLADCKIKFIATAFEMNTGRITYFQSYDSSSEDIDEIVIGPDSNISLVDVCMASCAAQSYFPAHTWNNYKFWDGGSSGFNAPDMLAISEAKLFSPLAEIKMLSLGNGRTPWPYKDADMTNPNLMTMLNATLDIAYFGPECAMVWLAREELGANYTRINPVIPDFAIDDASLPTLVAMQSAALEAITV